MECHKGFEHSVVASIFGDAGHGNFMRFILVIFSKLLRVSKVIMQKGKNWKTGIFNWAVLSDE